MYSDRINVGVLTSLLVSHKVKHVIVCPGSRNSPLVHNFDVCPDITCHPVTDERSAGFFALGIRLQTGEKTAVCVTSGSALLNVLPAAAEATYRQQGIIVISADRPSAWIGQHDGQTLPQQGVLGCFSGKSVTVPEPHDDITRWECNRLINEALLENERPTSPSVHINIPISEPLFNYTVMGLPEERTVRRMYWDCDLHKEAIIKAILKAERPLIVIGQTGRYDIPDDYLSDLRSKIAILDEPLSSEDSLMTDQMLCTGKAPSPDLVLYLGGNTVSKRLRQFLREGCKDAIHLTVSPDGSLEDISCHTTTVIEGHPCEVISDINGYYRQKGSAYLKSWDRLRDECIKFHRSYLPPYSQMLAVKLLEETADRDDTFHYANSMSVRLGAIYADHYCFCNRGLNGIEGSLSTAAGASLAEEDGKVYCIIGDLSFFYDSSALSQTELGGNFRILLLNNRKGGIFNALTGFDGSESSERLIAAAHNMGAEHICKQYSLTYLGANDEEELRKGIRDLTTMESDRPVLLEVTTDPVADARIYKEYCHGMEDNAGVQGDTPSGK